jgi:hypothetical protein
VVRPSGNQYVLLKWAQTFDADAPGVRALDLAASRLLARWERRNQAGFRYVEELIRSGPLYQPRLGYTFRNDFSSSETRLQYLWFGGSGVPFRTFAVQAASKAYLRDGDRTAESGLIQGGVESQMKGGQQVTLTYRTSYESVRDTFSLSGGVLQVGVDYLFNALRFPDRGVSTDLHVARARVQAGYDAHLSLSTFLQYSNATQTANVNARLRYNFREGNDLWVVYDERANTDREGLVPEPPFSQCRALLVKYTHTLVR